MGGLIVFRAKGNTIAFLDDIQDQLNIPYRSDVIRLAIQLLYRAINHEMDEVIAFIRELKKRKQSRNVRASGDLSLKSNVERHKTRIAYCVSLKNILIRQDELE